MTTNEPTQHNEDELRNILSSELYDRERQSRGAADSAHRAKLLAIGALKEFTPGSPFAIAENAVLDAASRVEATETANADTYLRAAREIIGLR